MPDNMADAPTLDALLAELVCRAGDESSMDVVDHREVTRLKGDILAHFVEAVAIALYANGYDEMGAVEHWPREPERVCDRYRAKARRFLAALRAAPSTGAAPSEETT